MKTNSAMPSRCRAARGTISDSSKAKTANGLLPLARSKAGLNLRPPSERSTLHGQRAFCGGNFERLVALRMAEEKLEEAVAVAAVIRDNLFGGDRPALHADWRVQPGAGRVAARGTLQTPGDKFGLLRPRAEHSRERLAGACR